MYRKKHAFYPSHVLVPVRTFELFQIYAKQFIKWYKATENMKIYLIKETLKLWPSKFQINDNYFKHKMILFWFKCFVRSTDSTYILEEKSFVESCAQFMNNNSIPSCDIF